MRRALLCALLIVIALFSNTNPALAKESASPVLPPVDTDPCHREGVKYLFELGSRSFYFEDYRLILTDRDRVQCFFIVRQEWEGETLRKVWSEPLIVLHEASLMGMLEVDGKSYFLFLQSGEGSLPHFALEFDPKTREFRRMPYKPSWDVPLD